MSIEEAISVIRNAGASRKEHIAAACVLADNPKTPLKYLVECLRYKGLCTEIAVMKLYVRTRRNRIDTSIEALIVDAENWLEYLEDTNYAESPREC